MSYVRFEVLIAVVMKSFIVWCITPCSLFKVNRCFGGIYRLHLQGRRISRARNQSQSMIWELCLPPAFRLVSCSTYSSTLKMEAICSSETSVETRRTTRRHIPEDDTLHNHRCENLKSYISTKTLYTFIMYFTYNVHLIVLDLIILVTCGGRYGLRSSSLYHYLHRPIISSLLGPDILLSSLFSNTGSLCSSLNVSDQVPHPHNITTLIL
jgi:hypothetical protein